ncbi:MULTISPECIES: GNAT family N-acetyltransferase [Gordonia]|uniref:Histone acetyltransferase HPA2-related acetyltransferase n=1 Tax=Gordonia terrae C-6 TaxID=1316928 RepID=R7Y685_9ACTN|nr:MULTISPECIES: GNAT family N-acetyltransferase [Gordonia]AFR49323.1 Histone acetyltransferase HPA2-related acetyltransferase [Gordonia sp. KTR9]EON31522.1 Histone acetyltransferase HPA2-related acetyltransferase [Gordonia terrae C-6]
MNVHNRARLATTADAATIADLLDEFNREFDEPSPGPVALARRLHELLSGASTFAVVAGAPIVSLGLVTIRTNVWVEGGIALLDEMYTTPAERSRGLGSAVLTAAVAEATRRGAGEFEIEVDEPDVDAHRFYARHGFPMRDPATGDRAFVLRKELSTP